MVRETPAALLRAVDDAIDRDAILDTLAVLAAEPSPYGRERATAERLAAYAAARWPELSWQVEPLPVSDALPDSANLVAGSALGSGPPELLFYSHLDTSLTGAAAFDEPITGRPDPVPALRRPAPADPEQVVDGFGLGVARAAAAAALVGFTAAAYALRAAGQAHRLTLLLAAAGTHRNHPTGPVPGGVAHHLDHRPAPAAAVVAKSGPPGILTAEPGAMFLRVRLATRHHPALARDTAAPPGGLILHLGPVLAALEAFRRQHLRERAGRTDQVGAEVGVGSIRAGRPGKPDLLPGQLDLHLYLVTVPGDDPAAITATLRDLLTDALRHTPLGDCRLTVDGWAVHEAAATPDDAPVSRHAHAVWLAVHGAPPAPIQGWTGSTDGVVLRGRGVPTVRLGPAPLGGDPRDPRRDRYAVTELLRFARAYAGIAVRYHTPSTE
ncbi:hypothetical protein ACGFIG_24310 [Micromonospora sp. NPDC049048]|uniref:hypothetical protein n=1 Tax=Micromonospora sp. NPDC049048 TaxID=3364263 RepID=UPI003721B871